jgi:hypothetical protein
MLAMVSWLMPRSAGSRWLAEAESLLSEITAAVRDSSRLARPARRLSR